MNSFVLKYQNNFPRTFDALNQDHHIVVHTGIHLVQGSSIYSSKTAGMLKKKHILVIFWNFFLLQTMKQYSCLHIILRSEEIYHDHHTQGHFQTAPNKSSRRLSLCSMPCVRKERGERDLYSSDWFWEHLTHQSCGKWKMSMMCGCLLVHDLFIFSLSGLTCQRHFCSCYLQAREVACQSPSPTGEPNRLLPYYQLLNHVCESELVHRLTCIAIQWCLQKILC